MHIDEQVCLAPVQDFAARVQPVHTMTMRANVNLDVDAYAFASTYASAKGIPLGAAISELLRRAEEAPERSSSVLTTSRRGLLVKAAAGRVVTSEMAKQLSEDSTCTSRRIFYGSSDTPAEPTSAAEAGDVMANYGTAEAVPFRN